MVEYFTGKTSCAVVAAAKSVSSLTGTDGHGDLRQLCRTVVVNNNAAVFIDGVILVFLFFHIIVLSWFGMDRNGNESKGMINAPVLVCVRSFFQGAAPDYGGWYQDAVLLLWRSGTDCKVRFSL